MAICDADPLYWPMFVIAVLAAIIASQAMISGTFSIVQQSLSLGCFPRVQIVHTSTKYEGQVYIPEINYLLMVACIGVTLGFRSPTRIGNAYGNQQFDRYTSSFLPHFLCLLKFGYSVAIEVNILHTGIAVVFVMTLTSSFLVLIMIMIWKTHILLVMAYVLVIGSVELLYLSSVLYKFDQGGYLPLAFAAVLMTIMYVWNDVYRRKYYYELDHKISPEKLKQVISESNLCQIRGLAICYSELVHGIPPIFKHYVGNVPALHSVLVFVSIKSLPISKVPADERFLFRRVETEEFKVFRCVVRYGYTDIRNEQEQPFETMLIEKLKEFLLDEIWFSKRTLHNHESSGEVDDGETEKKDHLKQVDEEKRREAVERETEEVDEAWRAGIVHLVGENEVVAGKGAGIGKRILIDYAYNFLKRNLRQSDKVLVIPHKRMLKVGMTYEL